MLINRVNGGFTLLIKLVVPTQAKVCVLMLVVTIFRKEMGYCSA